MKIEAHFCKISDQRRPRSEGESRGDMSARGEARRSRGDAPPARPAPLSDLVPILAAAEKQWKNNPVATINIIQPNTAKAEIELRNGKTIRLLQLTSSSQIPPKLKLNFVWLSMA